MFDAIATLSELIAVCFNIIRVRRNMYEKINIQNCQFAIDKSS